MAKETTKDWNRFEETVARYLKSLDPDAEVIHNTRTIDKDTGQLRQRDVWIRSDASGNPIKTLVSCKFWKNKLDVSDIDTFVGEFRASEANVGVIYAKSGFTGNAIIKAKKHGINCCILYQDTIPDIPETLMLKYFYCNTKVALLALDIPENLSTWHDLFELRVGSKTVLDEVANLFKELEQLSIKKENFKNLLPKDWGIIQNLEDNNKNRIQLQLTLRYRIYEAELAGYLVNGSYNFSDEIFKGFQNGPTMSVKTADPGEHWNLLKKRPEIVKNVGVIVASEADFYDNLKDGLGPKEVVRKI